MTRHLHRDYHTAFCGIDAAHVLMTYDRAEADCADCHAAEARYLAEQAAEEERQRRETVARALEEKRLREEAREAGLRETERLAAEQAQRDAEQLQEWIAKP